MADAVRGVVSHEIDTSILFEKFTIDEIRDVEKKTRADIERKKEELRQMVGERYRDLIEAADTITEMKACAENVTSSISRMQNFCQNLKQMPSLNRSYSTPKKDTPRHKAEVHSYGLATQIKLLHDMPEKIWSALDSRSYLLATRLFLLARHVNTSLQLDSQHSARVLTRFPVLSTQWAAIGHFKATVLQSCRETLKEADIPDQMAAECLCSILLLEDSTPRQVFNELLLLRTSSVQQSFQTDHSHVSIKGQVRDTITVIITTVRQIYAVFYSPKEGEQALAANNLLMSTLEAVTSQGEEGAILELEEGSVSRKYMPVTVTSFRPTLRNHASPVSPEHLQQNCQQWVQTCVVSVKAGLEKLLSFITTVKGLASIRNEIWNILNQNEKMSQWNEVCHAVLNHQMSPWEELFQQLFLTRNKNILQGQFDGALNAVKQQIGKVLVDLGSNKEKYIEVERHLSQYVWTESSSDIPANSAWTSVSQKSLQDAGPLLMKARAYTPAVQSLCSSLDGKLRNLLDDAACYLQPLTPESGSEVGGPFNKYADDEAFQTFIMSTCNATLQKFLDHLGRELYACKQQLSGCQDKDGQTVIINRVLLLARLSIGLCELSPHLQMCMLGNREKPEGTRLKRGHSLTRTASKSDENTSWSKLRERLQEFSEECYSTWTGHMTQCYQKKFSDALLDSSGQAVLLATTRWDEIEIKEETEDGQTIKSMIRVPMQPSWYIQSMLYELCEEINRVGGHALNGAVLQQLIANLSEHVMSTYEQLLKQKKSSSSQQQPATIPLSQVRSLQLLFDVKFLSNTLPRREDTEVTRQFHRRVSSIVEKFERQVDPFDLDVFSPYIQSHLLRQSHRSQVLFGALTSIDKHSLYMTGPKSLQSGHQEQHNILPLTTSQSRFPMLPLSVQTRSSAAPIMQPPKPKTMHPPMTSAESPPTSPEAAPEASSFLGTMSTIWFTKAK